MNNQVVAKIRSLLRPSVRLFGKKKKEKEPMDAYEAELDKPTERIRDDSNKPSYIKQQEKGADEAMQDQQEQEEEDDIIKVDPRFVKQSSELYKRFLQGQERPMVTKDNYQFNMGVILHRLPIFLPYNKQLHKIMRQRYALSHKLGFYNTAPKVLSENTGNPQEVFERQNTDNMITHLKRLPDGGREIYAENSKYWKLVDPEIKDQSSVQYKPSEMVFLIVKNQQGQWIFPDQPVKEKQGNFDEALRSFILTLTGSKNTAWQWLSPSPIYVHKRQAQVPRGTGIKTFYYQAVHIAGKVNHQGQLTSMWKQHKWIPKGQLSQYLQADYFNTIIRSVTAIM